MLGLDHGPELADPPDEPFGPEVGAALVIRGR